MTSAVAKRLQITLRAYMRRNNLKDAFAQSPFEIVGQHLMIQTKIEPLSNENYKSYCLRNIHILKEIGTKNNKQIPFNALEYQISLETKERIYQQLREKNLSLEAKRNKRAQKQAEKSAKRNNATKSQKQSHNHTNTFNNTTFDLSKVDPTSNEFLFTFEWRTLRMKAIQKYGRRCMCCGATPEDGITKICVDHIKPRKFFPELALDLNNLQILCQPCNHGKGNWNQTDYRKQS